MKLETQNLAAGLSPLIVVLGDDPTGKMHAQLAGLPLRIALNPHWRAGMGTSIRTGMHALADTPNLAGILLTLCDQPLVTAPVLRRLLDTFRATGLHLAAASYNGTLGVPAAFGPQFFPALLALPDTSGAKPILQSHCALLQSVPMPEAADDIDSPHAYAALLDHPAT